MNHAENDQQLGENQFGGRKRKNAQQVAIINELIIEYHRITHQTISIMHQDVKACFDRKFPNVTTIANRKYNIPPKIFQLVNNTKKAMKYYQ